jgi:hypothetical protein
LRTEGAFKFLGVEIWIQSIPEGMVGREVVFSGQHPWVPNGNRAKALWDTITQTDVPRCPILISEHGKELIKDL